MSTDSHIGSTITNLEWLRRVSLGLIAIVIAAPLGLVLGPMLPVHAGGETWYQFRHGANHDGFALIGPTPSTVQKLHHVWTFGKGGMQSDPVAGSIGQVFFTGGGRLNAFNADNGHKLWSRPWSGISDLAYAFFPCTSVRCNTNRQLIYGVDGGAKSHLRAMNASGGKTEWTFSYPALSWPTVEESARSLAPRAIFVSSRKGTVLALRPGGGQPLWTVEPGGTKDCTLVQCPAINSVTPAVSGNLVYVTTVAGRVYALASRGGGVVWSKRIGDRGSGPTSIAVSGNHLLIATNSAEIVALDPANGHRQWMFTRSHDQAPGMTTGLSVAYGYSPTSKSLVPTWSSVLVTGLGRESHGTSTGLVALKASNGHVRWTFHTSGTAMAPSVGDRVAYVTDTQKHLYALNAKTGRRIAVLRLDKGSRGTYPAVSFDWVYVANSAFEAPSDVVLGESGDVEGTHVAMPAVRRPPLPWRSIA